MMRYELVGDDVAVITWDLPDRPVNVMNDDSLAAFEAALARAVADPKVRGGIIASAKRDFVAGADLPEFLADRRPQTVQAKGQQSQRLLRAIETAGKPFVAAINGTALGGGLEIALACHRRIVADRPGILIGLPEVTLGLLPGAGGTQRLPRMLGIRKALPFLLEGRKLSPQQALAAGIVDELIDPAALIERAVAWIRASTPEDAVKPWDRKGYRLPGGDITPAGAYELFALETARLNARTLGNYPAPRHILSCVYEGCQTDIDSGLKAEASHFIACLGSAAALNLIRTSFFGVTDAVKLKRRPKGIPSFEFRKIGIRGAGVVAAGIAHAATGVGLEVVRGTIPSDDAPTTATGDFAGCDVVLDASRHDRVVIAASPSPGPEDQVGLRFASPFEHMRLVEVVRGPETGAAGLARAFDLARRLGKVPLLVKDARGLYVRRVSATYLDEALAMIAEGVLPALIENAARQAGMPIGPLALADDLSFEMLHRRSKHGSTLAAAAGVIARFHGELDRPGRSAGRGFYDYAAEGRRLWADLGRHFPPAAQQPGARLVGKRLLYIQALEAVRCLEDEVVATAQDADVGALLGWGFPSFHGGPISMIESIEIGRFIDECESLAGEHGDRFRPPALLRRMAEAGEHFYAA